MSAAISGSTSVTVRPSEEEEEAVEGKTSTRSVSAKGVLHSGQIPRLDRAEKEEKREKEKQKRGKKDAMISKDKGGRRGGKGSTLVELFLLCSHCRRDGGMA